jgi:putative CocE/NonD family hydrolase
MRRRLRPALSLLCVAVVTAAGALAFTVSGPGGAGAQIMPDPVETAEQASAAPGSTWTPGPETYGHRVVDGVDVRMSDGVVLSANIDYPTDPKTNEIAAGPFPVLLTMTPYGKDTGAAAGLGTNPYFVKRGYVDVSVDVRGTGASGGTFDLFDPKQTTDGVQLVNWAATIAHSDGKVGLHGASYLGVDQMLTAGAVGPNSPLKAIFPVVTANDVYRDTSFMGGIPDFSFDSLYLAGLLPATNILNPMISALAQPSAASILRGVTGVLAHVQDALNYNARFLLTTYLGGPDSYDNAYWQAKGPGNVLDKIVANGIPAYLIGGEFDLFQRGEPLNYAGLQNAWAGRPVTAPMLPGQATTGRYQLLDGPYTHLQGGGIGSNFNALELEWFDTWLKGVDTGMAQTPTPLHYYDLGTGTYAETTTYPFTDAIPTTYYFDSAKSGSALSQNDGTLSTAQPTATTGADPLLWSPVAGTICGRQQDQWVMGATSLVTGKLPAAVPCIDDDRPAQIGPTALTYTTAPFTAPRTIAGPISATVYATASTTETEWVVNVEDVAPNGTSKPLTEGALLGSQRALDASRSWSVDGSMIMPYHPYTKQAATAVVPGKVTRYDIEVFPTFSTIAAGHRIRVTLSSSDFPHLLPTPPELLKLLGGHYQVQRTATAPSSVTISLIGS